MANIYGEAIYKMINLKEEIKEKLDGLIKFTNDDIEFSKNQDGSIACYVKYKGYNASIKLEENEIFKYASQERKNPSDAIKELIEEKLFFELLKTNE